MAEADTIITDDIVERAARALNLEAGRLRGLTFVDDWETLSEGDKGGWRLCARKALEAVQGNLEQQIATWQVRRLRDNGICPTCGHEPAANLMD